MIEATCTNCGTVYDCPEYEWPQLSERWVCPKCQRGSKNSRPPESAAESVAIDALYVMLQITVAHLLRRVPDGQWTTADQDVVARAQELMSKLKRQGLTNC